MYGGWNPPFVDGQRTADGFNSRRGSHHVTNHRFYRTDRYAVGMFVEDTFDRDRF
jgi:hypothetical protein